MPLALSLDEIAARVGGAAPSTARSDPERWAYALREAVALARPDALVVGWDAGHELHGLREAAGVAEDDAASVVDGLYDAATQVRDQPSGAALVTLVSTLVALFPSGPQPWPALVGPATLAGLLGDGGDHDELADLCADQLADLLRACAEAGAPAVVLREPAPAAGVDPAAARGPLLRAAEHHGIALHVVPGAPGVEFVAAGLWLEDAAAFAPAFARLRALAASGTVVLGDGPVPGAVALERFQA